MRTTIGLVLTLFGVVNALRVSLMTTRRQAALGIGGGMLGLVGLPNAAIADDLLFDPIGAYNFGGGAGTAVGPVRKNLNGKPNGGILLLRECFDGKLPEDGLVEWYTDHLASDFTAVFAGGKVVLDKQQYLAVTKDLLKSFPDFTYTREGKMKYENGPTSVSWTAVVKGTHLCPVSSPPHGLSAECAK